MALQAVQIVQPESGVGQRAYNATRILQQNGFRVRNLSGGMQTFSAFEGLQE